jgi:hypothetical protein
MDSHCYLLDNFHLTGSVQVTGYNLAQAIVLAIIFESKIYCIFRHTTVVSLSH